MNLSRFGLLKTSDGKIAPEGTIEKLEISEEEARMLPPDAYAVEIGPPTALEHFAAGIGANLGLSLSAGAGLSALSSSRSRAAANRQRAAGLRPIPPDRPVKYVKLEKRTSKEFVEKVKKELGVIDLDGTMIEMGHQDLLHHFPSLREPGEIDKNLFARNVVWHYHQEIEAGRIPDFAKEGCNIRTIFYLVKPIFTERNVFTNVDFYDNFTDAFQRLVEAGLISYRDFNIMDDRKPFRFLPDSDFNTHILLLSEKKAFAGRFSALASKYGVMAQITDGQSTVLMADTMLTEMAEAGFDMNKNLNILSFCDFDPVGTSIPYHLVQHFNTLGFYNINEFTQYGDQVMNRLDEQLSRRNRPVYKKVSQRRPCLDIVNPHELDRDVIERGRHRLESNIANNPSTADWAFITGGVTGTGRNKEFVISSEQFLPYVNEHLEKKILPLLDKPPEAVGKRSNFKFLHKAIREYIGARAERDALAAAKLPKR